MLFTFIVFGFMLQTKAQNTNRIQAKSFVQVSPGVQVDGTQTCIGWITNGAYAYYGNVNFGQGNTIFRVNTSSIQSGSAVEIRLDSPGGVLAGKLVLPNTGDWSKYETVETKLAPIMGTHGLYLVFTGGEGYVLNLAWFEYLQQTPQQATKYTAANKRIQADSYVKVTNYVNKADIGGSEGTCIGWISNGDYAYYGNFDFGNSTSYFRARASSATEGGNIEIRLDNPAGSIIGKLVVSNTGDWGKYETNAIQIYPTSGNHDLYLTFSGGQGYLLNLAWFEFSPSGFDAVNSSNTGYGNSSNVSESEIFNNWNKSTVINGTRCATYFYLAKRTTITRIMNYHWNNGRGQTPGQIGIKSADGRNLGFWNSVGTSGTGGATNVNWEARPNIVLEPGIYEITDSDIGTWSQNYASFGAGFSMVYGQ